MENSSSSFTNLLHSSNTSGDPQNPNSQQHPNFTSPYCPMNYPPPQFPPNFQIQYPNVFNPFGGQANYPQFPSTQGSYGASYQGYVGQNPRPGAESPLFGSTFFFAGSRGGNSSRGDETSPIDPSSPVSIVQQPAPDSAENEVFSESSPDESEKREGRVHWGEAENLRLVSAWLKNSNDPIRGNDKRGDRYWKDIAAEYNKYVRNKDQRRSATQCKNHWNKTVPFVTKFNACYDKARREHGSGESDDQVMERARAEYKKMVKTKRPFALEHWWRAVKDQPKWSTSYPIEEMVKRTRLNASGSYSTSNQDSEDADVTQRHRPQGRNAARAQEKGKEKCKSKNSEGITDEGVKIFNELQIRQQAIAEKMADATLAQAKAELEKAKVQKLEKYMALLDKDTTDLDDVAKERHEQMLAFLARELFS